MGLVVALVWEGLNLSAYQILILTHGWVITTSGFQKQTAAILEFYFQFAVWSYTSVWYALPPSFVDMTIHAEIISIYLKSNVALAAILDL